MADKKPELSPLDSPGFHLLKQNKTIAIGGRNFIRLKDVTIKKGEKSHVEKNIKKISYVENSLIKTVAGNDPDKFLAKHFEVGVVAEIPKLKHENIKNMQARLDK